MIVAGISHIFEALNLTHDNAAAIVREGEIIAVAEEERFNRQRHTRGAAHQATLFCLEHAGVKFSEIDHVAMANNPYKLFANLDFTPRTLAKNAFITTCAEIQRFRLAKKNKARAHFVDHHLAHAASGFFCSEFDQANILVIDGGGESETFSFFVGQGRHLKKIWEIKLGRTGKKSIGAIYTNISQCLGFGKYGQGKTMALAAFGSPTRRDLMDLFHIKSHRDFCIDRSRVNALCRTERRKLTEQPLKQQQYDLAASVQYALEQNIINLAKEAYAHSPIKNWILTGGVALNCPINTQIMNQPFCDRIYIPPHVHDGGLALGAALFVANAFGNSRPKPLSTPYLGPEFSDPQIESLLRAGRIQFRSSSQIEKDTAKLLCCGKIVGWFQGRMEIGPRALGNRSILADPTIPGINDRINRDVKNREIWRPFGASVIEEEAGRYFQGLEKCGESPFMLQTFSVAEEYRKVLPGITHVDGSSRIQTVRENQNPRLYTLLKEVQKNNGHPVCINTSFNRRGEPIVCTPHDAIASFYTTGMDVLVLGKYIIEK